MTSYVSPFRNLAVSLNGTIDTPQSRKFGVTTRTLASNLLNATREALTSGNESQFINAYLAYADRQPSNITVNGGGQRFDVLTKMITSLGSITNPATVSQGVLIELGNRMPTSSDGPPRNSLTMPLTDMIIRVPEGVKRWVNGVDPVHLDVENTKSTVAIVSIQVSQPSSFCFSSYDEFVYAPAGGPDNIATQAAYIRAPAAGLYNIKVEAGKRLSLYITGETPMSAYALSDLSIASAGYNRAKRDGIITNTREFATLDEWLVGVTKRFAGMGNPAALMILYFESYEMTARALSLSGGLRYL